jgi:hypothetical protein
MANVNFRGGYAIPRADLGAPLMEFRWDHPAPEFIGGEILTDMPVKKKSATFPRLRVETLIDNPDTVRAKGGAYNRGNFELEDDTYLCKNYGFEQVLDDEDRENYASDFDAEMAAVMIGEHRVALARERRIAAAVFNTTTWTGSSLYTDKSGTPWSTASTDWIAHVQDAVQAVIAGSGMLPDTLIISQGTWTKLMTNDKTRAQFPGAPKITIAMIQEVLASLCGLERILVGRAVYNTKPQGSTAAVPAFVWGNGAAGTANYAMVAKLAKKGADPSTPCIGRSPRWEPLSASEFVVQQYREEQTESDVFRVKNFLTEKILIPGCGHLLKIETA